MKMKHLMTLLCLFLVGTLFAQVDPVPLEYQEEYDRLVQESANYEYDAGIIRLNPLDNLFIEPTELTVKYNGNWAPVYLKIDGYEDYIVANNETKNCLCNCRHCR
jgi:hypothetical protein